MLHLALAVHITDVVMKLGTKILVRLCIQDNGAKLLLGIIRARVCPNSGVVEITHAITV